MPRKKKSRKIGLIGVRKQADGEFKRTPSDKPKKKVGRPAGSRHSVAKESNESQRKAKGDPRLGSKKPIALVEQPKASTAPTKKPQKRYFSPQQELDALEADTRLQALLDAIDQGKSLSQDDQGYVDTSLARHQQLCKLLGIEDEDDAEDQDDPMLDIDPLNMDDYTR